MSRKIKIAGGVRVRTMLTQLLRKWTPSTRPPGRCWVAGCPRPVARCWRGHDLCGAHWEALCQLHDAEVAGTNCAK